MIGLILESKQSLLLEMLEHHQDVTFVIWLFKLGAPFLVMGRTMFDVRSSFDRRQKLGVRVRLLTNEHVQCSFDVRSTVRRTFNEHRKQNLSIL